MTFGRDPMRKLGGQASWPLGMVLAILGAFAVVYTLFVIVVPGFMLLFRVLGY